MISGAGGESSSARRYGLGLLSVPVALGVRIALEPVAGLKWPFILFALAVMVAARFGGLGPGLVATGTSLLAVRYFLLEPRYSFAIPAPGDIGGLVVFVIVGAGISLLSGRRSPSAGRRQSVWWKPGTGPA